MSIDLRPRARLVLGAAVVFGSLLVPARDGASVAVHAVSIAAPAQIVLARGGRSLALTLTDLSRWRRSAREVRRLRRRNARLAEELARERNRSAELQRRLAALGDFVRGADDWSAREVEPVGEAEVVGEGADPRRGVLFIDRGARHGVRPGMVVIAGRSVVGTVRAVAPAVSSVLLVTSPASRMDAQLTRTGEPGVVVGNGDGTMRMMYVSKHAARAGDTVVTRGRDGVTPKHLLLGVVLRSQRRPGGLVYDVLLRPVRDLERLPGVVVVRPRTGGESFPQTRGRGGRSDG